MEKVEVIPSNKCTGCMACKNICPVNAIKIEENSEGFLYPIIDKSICIKCGICENICPVINKKERINPNINAYYCKNIDEVTRIKSSSGGIFSLISEYILENNGVVFGVRFNEKFELIHDYITKKSELNVLRGSKYLQSKIGNNYKIAKQFLDEGKKVVFSGTPCQIEGLLSYLKKDYENLYTQDIICHGVPSPKVWKKYLEYKKEKSNRDLKSVSFRKKEILGWHNYQISYKYDGIEENIHHKEDPYMKMFLNNIDLRRTCYDCTFKKVNRNSDITLADAWGINKVYPEFNDEKGTSVIIIHSNKGKEIFDYIKNNIEFKEIDIDPIIKYNSSIHMSALYNKHREDFFEDVDKLDFEELIKKYL